MKSIQLIILTFFSFQLSYSQTAEQLNNQSKELLGESKFEKAIIFLRKAAELGNGEAQYNLGYSLQNGVGTEKNLTEAIYWYKKSSDNNFNDGHYAMMMAYGNGDGVEQNSELAFSYAIKCANNNDPTCMWNVVNCYITGNGVEKNEGEFKVWLIRLAKLNNPENLAQSGNITSARLELAKSYREGNYFEQDVYQSYLWYIIYNESKKDFSILLQQKSIEDIKALEKELSKKQFENGKLEAEKLLGRKLNNYSQLYKTSL